MATKTLYVLVSVLVSDNGDGSYCPKYTFNADWIAMMEEKDANGELDSTDPGCDGDGFHYDTIDVPEECTLASLGISDDIAEDYDDFDEDFDDV